MCRKKHCRILNSYNEIIRKKIYSIDRSGQFQKAMEIDIEVVCGRFNSYNDMIVVFRIYLRGSTDLTIPFPFDWSFLLFG